MQWDLSVAEHLQPGESYREVVTLCQSHRANAQLTHGRHPPQPWHIPVADYCDMLPLPGVLQRKHGSSVHALVVNVKGMLVQAASRGLQEELGISAAATTLIGPLVPDHLRRLHVPEVGVTDCEFVTSFRSALRQGLK